MSWKVQVSFGKLDPTISGVFFSASEAWRRLTWPASSFRTAPSEAEQSLRWLKSARVCFARKSMTRKSKRPLPCPFFELREILLFFSPFSFGPANNLSRMDFSNFSGSLSGVVFRLRLGDLSSGLLDRVVGERASLGSRVASATTTGSLESFILFFENY